MRSDPAPTVRLRRAPERVEPARPRTTPSRPSRPTARTTATPRHAPSSAQRAAGDRGRHARVASGRLLDWSDLGGAPVAPRAGRIERSLARLSSRGVLALLIGGAVLFTAYEAHVYATSDALAAVQAARHENARLHLKLNRLRGEFDAATSPSVVVARARALGLSEGIGYGPTLHAGR